MTFPIPLSGCPLMVFACLTLMVVFNHTLVLTIVSSHIKINQNALINWKNLSIRATKPNKKKSSFFWIWNFQLLPANVSHEGVWWLGDERREVPQLPGSPAAPAPALCGLLRLRIPEEKCALLSERGHGLLPHPQCRQQLYPDSQETHKSFP